MASEVASLEGEGSGEECEERRCEGGKGCEEGDGCGAGAGGGNNGTLLLKKLEEQNK